MSSGVYLSTILTLIWMRAYGYDYSGWDTPDEPRLPRSDYGIAVGYYNNTILLFGGFRGPTQLTAYSISNDNFYGEYNLSNYAWGNSQYYTQINHLFYWIDSQSTTTIIVYNLMDKRAEKNITVPHALYRDYYACLASSNDSLFYVGGYCSREAECGGTFYSNLVKLYNLASMNWSTISSMQQDRGVLSCVVDSAGQHVYAIGGSGTDIDFLNSVERISLDDIFNQKWIYLNDTLIELTGQSRAVVHKDLILIIGGYNGEGALALVQVINCNTGDIALGGYMDYSVRHTAAILVDTRIYAFGGYMVIASGGAQPVDTFQYVDLRDMHRSDGIVLMIVVLSLSCLCCIGCVVRLWCCYKKRRRDSFADCQMLMTK